MNHLLSPPPNCARLADCAVAGTGLNLKSDIAEARFMGRPSLWGRLAVRAFTRSWGRDVMLYTGGVSFFALLAVFPAIAILIGFYKVVMSIGQVGEQAAALADVLPSAARAIFLAEIERLANTSARTVSTQSAFALIVGAYAAHRGFKALLAGLNLIHDESEPHGFFRFNLLAFFVAVVAFTLFTIVSGAVVTLRLLQHAGTNIQISESGLPYDGLLPALGLALGLTLLYRYAMAHRVPVAWGPSVAGGLVATVMSMVSSWLCAVYVEQIALLGATYGSVGAVVVLLIWLSWNVNAIFYGGAFATELEIALRAHRIASLDPPEPLPSSVVNLSERRASRR
tara:strand:+ start:7185 stop:8204 length:1020 start_codon:yes stop_codon:yes gene_type:complete